MPTYPKTPASDMHDVLHGETIADPYRWLEDGEGSETREWTGRQNGLTQGFLSSGPGKGRIRTRLEKVLAIGVLGVPTPVRGRYFYLRREGRQNQPVLYWRQGAGGED